MTFEQFYTEFLNSAITTPNDRTLIKLSMQIGWKSSVAANNIVDVMKGMDGPQLHEVLKAILTTDDPRIQRFIASILLGLVPTKKPNNL